MNSPLNQLNPCHQYYLCSRPACRSKCPNKCFAAPEPTVPGTPEISTTNDSSNVQTAVNRAENPLVFTLMFTPMQGSLPKFPPYRHRSSPRHWISAAEHGRPPYGQRGPASCGFLPTPHSRSSRCWCTHESSHTNPACGHAVRAEGPRLTPSNDDDRDT